jgi:tetratricopeptide (TPR) repeat protein
MKKVTPRLLVFAATLVLALFPMHGQGQSKNKKNDNKNNNAVRDQPRQAAPASPRVSSPHAQPQQPRVAAPQQAAPSRPTMNRAAPARQPDIVQRQSPKAPQRQVNSPSPASQRPAAGSNDNRKPEARPLARQSAPANSGPRVPSVPSTRPSIQPSARPSSSSDSNKEKRPSSAPKPASTIARNTGPMPSSGAALRPPTVAPRGPVASTPKPAAGKSDNRPNDKIHTENDRPKIAPKPSAAVAKGTNLPAGPRGSVVSNAPRPGGASNNRQDTRAGSGNGATSAPRPGAGVTDKLAGNYSPRGTVAANRPNAEGNRKVGPDDAHRPNNPLNHNSPRATNLVDNRAVNNMGPRGYITEPNRSATPYDQNRYRPGQVKPLAYRPAINRPVENRWAQGYSVWSPDYQTSQYRSHYYSSNFIYSVNYAYRPTLWGTRPWWGARHHHSWHSGCWDYGWNNHWSNRYRYYSRPASYYPPGYRSYYVGPSAIIPWGLAAWSLGSLAYDTGYYSYYNPYYAPPVQTRTMIINYSEPITVAATRYEPTSEEVALSNAGKSTAALERSRAAFRDADYLAAISAVDEAISWEPGDSALHEYRALVLFALGRYGDAAGVLNPVLASGPGWDWDTMIGLYDTVDRYTGQFRKLEAYVLSQQEAADAHFLLGYHYMVGGHLEDAYAMFDRVHELQPRDTVANQLRDLVGDSIPTDEPLLEETGGTEMVEVKRAPVEKTTLQGIWIATSGDGKSITLSMTDLGTFSWSYEGAAAGEVLKGDWSVDEDGFLVLADEDVQLVGDITLNEDGTLHFLLAGSPEGDPGLIFSRQ